MKKSTRFLSLLLSIIMILSILPVSSLAADSTGLDNFKKVNSYSSSTYTDVKSGDWFYDNVKSAFEYGLMVGKGNNLFDTDGNVTIAETMTIAARLHSTYYTGKADFEQSSLWYQVYTDYCKANGIANPAIYTMDAPATRAQFAQILANAMPNEAWKPVNKVANDAIPDVKITDAFGEAVYKLYRAGVLVGNDANGTFAPVNNIKRSEVSAIVTRMADISLRKSIKLGNEYTVTFDLNYSGKTLETQTVFEGETAVKPSNPYRSGYSFSGWYSQATGSAKFDFKSAITKDITLYAHWSINDPTPYFPPFQPGPTPPSPADVSYTRGEWVNMLAEKVNMNLDCDPNDIDYYFGDTEGNQNAIAIETAQAYGILPEADVEDLEQDIPMFNPNDAATREFAAYTAVKAMGFDGTNEFDITAWSDYSELSYPNEDAVAVGFNFLSLNSSNKFNPEGDLDTSDVNSIFAAIDEINNSTVVNPENAHDDTQYQEGILKDSLSTVTDYIVFDNGDSTYTVTIPGTSLSEIIEVGDVIILPANDDHITGMSFYVNSVGTDMENNIVLQCRVPDVEEVFESIDFAGVGTAIIGGIETPEDISCEYDQNDIDDDENLQPLNIDLGGSTKVPGKLKFTLADKKFSENLKASGTVEIEIPDVTCILDAHIGLLDTHVNEFTLSIQEKIKFKAELKYTLAESGYELTNSLGNTRFEKGRIELGRLPIAIGATGLSFDIVFFYNVEAKGTASISYTIVSTQGVQYKNGSLRGIFDFNDSLDLLELKGSAKVGLGVAGDICAFELMDIIGYSVELGAAINISFTVHTIATDTLYCGDATLYAYCTSGLDKETAIGKFLEKVCNYTLEFEHLKNDAKNPFKLKLHIENGHIVPECTFGTGAIEGYVEALDTHSPVSNARVRVYQGEVADNRLIRTRYTNTNGKYSIDNLTAGTYIVQVSATGYYTFTISDVSVTSTGASTYIETSLLIDRNPSSTGTVTGRITDAVTGNGITDATYVLRSGWNKRSGDKLQEGTFSTSDYSLSLNAGNYTLEVSKADYVTNYVNIAIGDSSSTTANVILNPEGVVAPGNSIRIILTWGETPADLDSHLFGPKVNNDSETFHTYYSNKDYIENSVTIANLDIDDTTSYGPETTTVYDIKDTGTYSFYVHDYTNLSSSSSTAMSLSGAKVQVYSGSVSVATFNIPTYKEGTVWHVFDYDAATDTIIPVNTFSYSSNSSTLK